VTRKNTARIIPMDIYKIYSQILPASRDKFVWFLNHEVLTDLLQSTAEPFPMAYASTPAYSATPLFQKSIVDPIAKTILGRPYFLTEKMSALGEAGDIGAFDLSYYLIGERQPLTIDASTHVYFTTDYTAWRFVERIDGQPWLASALTPYKGTATLSPFVSTTATS
jgi:HK97 family phage major capsid protein